MTLVFTAGKFEVREINAHKNPPKEDKNKLKAKPSGFKKRPQNPFNGIRGWNPKKG